jgi:hypothetical protein
MQRLATFGSFVVLVTSATLARAQQEIATLRGVNAGDEFGTSIAFVGDVDGDGHDDFAIGSPGTNSYSGSVTLYSGATTAALSTWTGGASGDRFGAALAGAGDIDNDGFDDVLVGAPRGVPWMVQMLGGYMQVRSGLTGAVLFNIVGPTNPHAFGAALAGGRDLDGDGVPDFIVGAPGGPAGDGAAYVYSGGNGALLRTHTPTDTGNSADGGVTLGFSLAFVGDIDGDGREEYALGAPGVMSIALSYVQLFDGATGLGLWRTSTGGVDEEFGFSMAALGDVTGDGLGDLVVGAREDASFGPAFGRVRVLDGATGAIIASYGQGLGASQSSGLGFAVTALGDLDGDGRSEFAGGVPGDEPLPNFSPPVHAARVWSLNMTAALTVLPVPGSLHNGFGMALASGDTDGDGLRDLLVAEPFDDQNGANCGAVHVYSIVRAPTVYCSAQVNSLGCTPSISSTGTASASSPQSFDIRATSVINNVSGLLYYSFAPQSTPYYGGTLCARQPLTRTNVQNSGGNTGASDCSGTFTFDFNALAQSGADPALVAGKQVFAQYWSRDAQAPSHRNTTDALAFFVEP